MSGNKKLPHGSVQLSHIWKQYRADRTRSNFVETMSAIKNRGYRQAKWVLRDVDLHIEPGESVGLVGLNGSGKSTLLKVLAGVTYPTYGIRQISGRLGALIEVRSGIHPELTGRENTHFYGTVLGLTRKQVAERFDAIVEFAELNDAIDRQVKYYSSGMQMRLGFSIAAFLEPDILLVDEALAVGDIGFQQRCLDRMKTVLQLGTTLVFVSHDMAAVEAMCQRTLWLDDGRLLAEGATMDVLSDYRLGLERKAELLAKRMHDPVVLTSMTPRTSDGGPPETGSRIDIEMTFKSEYAGKVEMCIGVSEGPSTPIFTLSEDISLHKGTNEIVCQIAHLPLPKGRYYLWIGAYSEGGRTQMPWHPAAPMDVDGPRRRPPPRGVMLLSPVHVTARWDADGADPDGARYDLATEGSPGATAWSQR